MLSFPKVANVLLVTKGGYYSRNQRVNVVSVLFATTTTPYVLLSASGTIFGNMSNLTKLSSFTSLSLFCSFKFYLYPSRTCWFKGAAYKPEAKEAKAHPNSTYQSQFKRIRFSNKGSEKHPLVCFSMFTPISSAIKIFSHKVGNAAFCWTKHKNVKWKFRKIPLVGRNLSLLSVSCTYKYDAVKKKVYHPEYVIRNFCIAYYSWNFMVPNLKIPTYKYVQ